MRRHAFPCIVFAGLIVLPGCGDETPTRGTTSDAGSATSATLPDATLACTAGELEPCVCSSGGIGSRPCLNGSFTGACESCAVRSDTSSGTLCVPGRYEGTYDVPSYYPTPTV